MFGNIFKGAEHLLTGVLGGVAKGASAVATGVATGATHVAEGTVSGVTKATEVVTGAPAAIANDTIDAMVRKVSTGLVTFVVVKLVHLPDAFVAPVVTVVMLVEHLVMDHKQAAPAAPVG